MDRVEELLIEKESLNGVDFNAIVSEFTSIPKKKRFWPFPTSERELQSAGAAETARA